MQGVLLVDKPAGWTSFDAVNYVRRIVATTEGKRPNHVKVGHSGTLDPFATGLLILLIGKEYTRRAAEFSKLDKTYEVTMKLGETSSTGDPEGEVKLAGERVPSEREIREAFQKFTGEIMQTPPAFSAIKVNGQRAYKLARAGREVKLKPRKARVNGIQLAAYSYPEVKFTADVASGTYIRALVEDIGAKLGTGAYTTALRRTTVGDFAIQDAIKVSLLDEKLVFLSLL